MVTAAGILSRPLANLVGGDWRPAADGGSFTKLGPSDGSPLCEVPRSSAVDVADAVAAAAAAFPGWAATPPVQRGLTLQRVVRAMQDNQAEIAELVALETGKSRKDAMGETAGAIALGLFFAGEGQRLYGRTATSGVPGRMAVTVREPIGIAGLLVPANTPIANVAWKVFPALVCGNTVVLKSSEDAPGTAQIFTELAREAGLAPGVVNLVHGLGPEAGAPLVSDPRVGVISFTGSTRVGREIHSVAGGRLARVSLELGGKNPMVICDDADLEKAVRWALLSAFSNAGQRCAAASRLVIFREIYQAFRDEFVRRASSLRVGPTDEDDMGPVISERQAARMLAAVEGAVAEGAVVLTGGKRKRGPEHDAGFYVEPTVLEGAAPSSEISRTELFGPIVCLYPVTDLEEAIRLSNDSPYGLTACIHTRDLSRAMEFSRRVQAGLVMVNAGTYGSEPHMPFGGAKDSGNGTREPGTEALDVYSSLKAVYLNP